MCACIEMRTEILYLPVENWNLKKLSHVVCFVTKNRRVSCDISIRSVGLGICSDFPACFLTPGPCFLTPKREENKFECKLSPSSIDKLLHEGTACLVGLVDLLCLVASLL